MEMGDYDVEDIVNGEFTRLGMSLLNLRIKDGMVQRGGSRGRERRLLEGCRCHGGVDEFMFYKVETAPTSTTEQWQPPVVQPDSGNSVDSIVECNCVVLKQFPATTPKQSTSDGVHTAPDQTNNLDILLVHRLLSVSRSHQDPARGSTKVCLLDNIAAIVSWSADKVGQYLTAYRESEHRTYACANLRAHERGPRMDAETLRQCAPPRFSPEKIARPKEASERLVFVLNKIDLVLSESTRTFGDGFAPHTPTMPVPAVGPGPTSPLVLHGRFPPPFKCTVVKQEGVDYLISDDGFCPPPHLHSTVSATCHGDPPLTQAEELTKPTHYISGGLSLDHRFLYAGMLESEGWRELGVTGLKAEAALISMESCKHCNKNWSRNVIIFVVPRRNNPKVEVTV
ncbi:hypothetical protein EDB84DRAFT_1443343 [Lactarius hengduanensis]|nr:hypothetical protein EDB84DRAFT_1443343 [Lactarius hengduanensis]